MPNRPAAPAASVVMPARNTASFIGDAIHAVRSQTLPDWELLVVDDGSTDATARIAEFHSACDARVRVVSHERPRGVSAARNHALSRARGEWVVFLDADDTLEPTALETLINTARDAGTDGAFGAYRVCAPDLRALYTYVDQRDEVGLDDLFDRAYLWTGAHAVRRERFNEPRPPVRFDESLTGYEDRDVWLRLAERSVRWACTDHPVANYRIRPGSASKDPRAMIRDAHRVVRACFERQERLPASARLLSCDQQRLDAALTHLALGYASRAAVLDPVSGAQRAAAIWDEFGPRDRAPGAFGVCPETAARAGQYALIYGLGRWPDAPTSADRWAEGLDAWWRTAGPAFGAEALAALNTPLTPGVKSGVRSAPREHAPLRAAG